VFAAVKTISNNERGQTLILAMLAFVVLVGVTALALDVGDAYSDKSRAQRAADSAALAAADALADGQNVTLAKKAAQRWADENGYGNRDSSIDVTVNIPPSSGPYAGNDEYVEVIIDHQANTHFAQVLDFNFWNIQARAVAGGNGFEPFTGLMPWAVLDDAIVYDGNPTVLKYDSDNVTNGNFSALGLGGTGSSVYENNIVNGAHGPICAQSQPGCTDPTESTETGNMVGSTSVGVRYRLDNTTDSCDEYNEVFTATGDLIPTCDPFLGVTDSLQVLLVPVVERFCNGSCDVTILYFALVFLNDLGTCTGNTCEVTATFVRKIYDPVTELGFDATELGDIYLAE
jgi:hypothetical protein